MGQEAGWGGSPLCCPEGRAAQEKKADGSRTVEPRTPTSDKGRDHTVGQSFSAFVISLSLPSVEKNE